MSDMGFKVIDNSKLVLQATERQILSALVIMGETAEGYAKRNCSEKFKQPTGRLMNSIAHSVDKANKCVYIGTNVHYAPYVEFGTGVHAETGGRQTPWAYQDDKGVWHRTTGQEPKPYLRPALSDHIEEYRDIAKKELSR